MPQETNSSGGPEFRPDLFRDLMAYRVMEILLVASPYDAFLLEEDGQLSELILEEYRNLELNLRYTPRLTHATEAGDALRMLGEKTFDMVVLTPRLRGMRVEDFTRAARGVSPGLNIGLLAAHAWDLPLAERIGSSGGVDLIFLWQGDAKALLAMIKQVEDRRNSGFDVREAGVQAIIVVEDSVRFYSTYLPLLYAEVTTQTSRLISEGLNMSQRLLRMRARPKILLAQSFEEAVGLLDCFSGHVLGVISDVSFPRRGELDQRAGLDLAVLVRERDPDVPVLLQSTDDAHRQAADDAGAGFLNKNAPDLLSEIRKFVMDHFGFGDFVFRLPDGTEVGRARDLRELISGLRNAPPSSILYHSTRNHFSAWLKARTEFELAAAIKPRKVSDFSSPEGIRTYLLDVFDRYRRSRHRFVIADFEKGKLDGSVSFAKIGKGSLGGKGRGLAFLHKMLASEKLDVEGLDLAVPGTLVLAADCFEGYIEGNSLGGLVRDCGGLSDVQILDAFRRGRFERGVRSQLADLLKILNVPLAVRSSSILEDSLYQPFAGVYATIMLCNSHPSLDVRLAQLLEAVKVVYASTYFSAAREYLAATPFRAEEERMAVLIQQLVGSRRGGRFYPAMSGVAASTNFYPAPGSSPSDGVAQIAFGLGKTVVDGFESLMINIEDPGVSHQFSGVRDWLKNAQRKFWALDMSRDDTIPGLPIDSNLARYDVADGLREGAGPYVASTFVPEDNAIRHGMCEGGSPLVTFAPILQSGTLPFARVLSQFLKRASDVIGAGVEVEFAMDLPPVQGFPPVFHFLQIRPLASQRLGEDFDMPADGVTGAVVQSDRALGHGRKSSIRDLVVVWPDRFDRGRSARFASAIESVNKSLREQDRDFVLIGPGRWGSQDHFLGIPVSWSQISGARTIVETDLADMEVDPSQGSHFFHNLVSFGVSYFTVNQRRGQGKVDWNWLSGLPREREELGGAVSHMRLDRPVTVLVDGSVGRGVIMP